MAMLTQYFMQRPKAFIIILNWNGLEDTSDCLNSCRAINYPNYRIAVVDNASKGNDADVLMKRFSDVDMLRLDTNLGYAGGNNAGICHALTHGAECVWLLNNDTVVDPDALSALVEEAFSSESIGCLGSKILFFDQPDIIWSAGGFYDLKKCLVGHYGYDQRDDGRYDNPRDVEYMNGCSILLKRDVLEKAGLLRDDYFMFFEDTEYSARLRQLGYRIRYVPASRVWHKVSRSIGRGTGLYEYYYYRNFLWFAKLHGDGIAFTLMIYSKRVFNKFIEDRDWRLAYFRIRGIVDFLRRKKGIIG
jgi:GT2 family glycosyltransferase